MLTIVALFELERNLANIQCMIQNKIYPNRLFLLHEDGVYVFLFVLNIVNYWIIFDDFFFIDNFISY